MPPRPSGAPKGQAFMRSVMELQGQAREDRIFAELRRGNFPTFMRRLSPVELAYQAPDGTGVTATFYTMPDVLAIGADDDYVRIPMGGKTAQRVADALGFLLPTGKMVQAIFDNATKPQLRITQTHRAFEAELARISHAPFRGPGHRQKSTAAYLAHHRAIEASASMAGRRSRDLVAGHKKIVTLSKFLFEAPYRGTLAFYGWFYKPSAKAKPRPTQGFAGAPTVKRRGETGMHLIQYADYSHGVRLIAPRMHGEGRWRLTADALKHDILHRHLSTEGPLPNPRIPDVPRP